MNAPSLRASAMSPLWEAVRDRLEREGVDNRGLLRVPTLDAAARLTLKNLLDRPKPPRRVDLARLETALVALGVGADLPGALAALGFEVSEGPARRRAERARGRAARQAAREVVEQWPEPWAAEWIDGVIRAGVFGGKDADAARRLVEDTRRVLDALDRHDATGGGSVSRVELAAQVLGDSHSLDSGRRLEAVVARALALRSGPIEQDDQRVWETAGVHTDLTSGPVLTWRLPVLGPLGAMVDAASAAGLPLHLSRMALIECPPRFVNGVEVLVAENPRVVEAAAQLGVEQPVVSAGGSPSGAVQLLVRQLVEAGVTVLYHGDFDSPGLALCARMQAAGVHPWRMTTDDYLTALADADHHGVELPLDNRPPGATPWDPGLSDAFGRERRIVHEERLLPALLYPVG